MALSHSQVLWTGVGVRLAPTPSGGPGAVESIPLPSCCQDLRFPGGSGVSLLLTAHGLPVPARAQARGVRGGQVG